MTSAYFYYKSSRRVLSFCLYILQNVTYNVIIPLKYDFNSETYHINISNMLFQKSSRLFRNEIQNEIGAVTVYPEGEKHRIRFFILSLSFDSFLFFRKIIKNFDKISIGTITLL